MKYIIILILALTLSTSYASRTQSKKNYLAKVEQVRNSHSWGSTLLKLAELHMKAKGPLDELLQAIQDCIDDLNGKLERTNELMDKRTEEHDSTVSRLEAQISDLEERVEETQTDLDTLETQKASLIESTRIEGMKMKDAKEDIIKADEQRAVAKELYEGKVAEHESAIEVIDECLEVLNSLFDEDSFVQVKAQSKAKETLAKLTKLVKKSKHIFMETSFIQAMVSLASENFVDQGAIQAVVMKFQEVRANLNNALAELKNVEDNDIRYHEARVTKDQDTIKSAGEQIEANNDNLVTNATNQQACQGLIIAFNIDLVARHTELDAENVEYTEYVAAYEEMVAEFHKELNACTAALDVINGLDFDDYIGDRINGGDGPMELQGGHGPDQ